VTAITFGHSSACRIVAPITS